VPPVLLLHIKSLRQFPVQNVPTVVNPSVFTIESVQHGESTAGRDL
jgi:hypothetical protein